MKNKLVGKRSKKEKFVRDWLIPLAALAGFFTLAAWLYLEELARHAAFG